MNERDRARRAEYDRRLRELVEKTTRAATQTTVRRDRRDEREDLDPSWEER